MCVAAAVAGASLAGGALSSSASKSAAQDQQNAANTATQAQTALTQQQLATLQGNTKDYRNTGNYALASLANALGIAVPGVDPGNGMTAANVSQLPGYQFQLQQGEQAMKNSGAASGGALSSATLTGLNNYAQGQAQSYYGSYLGQLGSLASLGENASVNAGNQESNALGNLSNNVGSNTIGAGNAEASGTIGSNNAIVGGLTNGAAYGAYGGTLGSLGGQSPFTNFANSTGVFNNNSLPGGNDNPFDNFGGQITTANGASM